ncbi:MFS transporter [Sinorhizobium americanum]|uniref:Membrane protein mosC n=1 Tax=Sinorhizobium americanum TaxID=194963 RepID=A0A1L3LU74_9HYPH|nr:MFS transporter [Sinorhizobium americanum]APG87124.1 membrane protein mosC [Sinorhizobium americanum CCGM7]APG93638.1 membrane protein mosC [Sinorhizobium americanum]OAP43967.1 hypothetical protein ATC00_27920 [Sinorhizobium americanum]
MTNSKLKLARRDFATNPEADAQLRGSKRATRLSYFISGFALACWAPMVPYAQSRIDADSATLGSVLLCLGLGAVVGMPTAGIVSNKVGSRPVLIAGAVGLATVLPLMALLANPITLAIALLLFGCSIGAIDVATNMHGAEVQDLAGVPLMSGFHGVYSIGGLVGAAGMTFLVALGPGVLAASAVASSIMIICIICAVPGFLRTKPASDGGSFAIPRGGVLPVGLLLLVIFLAEGAMLDWGAILLTSKKLDVSFSGSGYALFAIAMTVSRFLGDKAVERLGESRMLFVGISLAALSIIFAAYVETVLMTLTAITVAGLAAGNIVPILFSLAAIQRSMPTPQAIAATGTLGYAGILIGPALIGHAAEMVGLANAIAGVGILAIVALLLIPAISFRRPTIATSAH